VPVITASVRTLAAAAREITTVVVEAVYEQGAQIAMISERSRVVRRDIVPVLAVADSHKWARGVVDRTGYDSDIRRDVLNDLDEVRQRRRAFNAERWRG
jgi:hypothetical protein